MKFALFNGGNVGLVLDKGIVNLSDKLELLKNLSGQLAMNVLISEITNLKSEIIEIERSENLIGMENVTLEAPLPSPSKILCMGGNFTEFGHKKAGSMWGFLKSSSAIIGPNMNVILPSDDANIFHHEAELVLVFGKSGKNVKEEEAFDYIFGYTCGVDVSARMPAVSGSTVAEFQPWRGISAPKSYDTFAPIGPVIVTKDEISDPHNLQVQLSVDGELRGDFNTSDMAHSIAKSIAFVSSFESFQPGDLLYTGTNHQGLGAMQDGDTINISIEGVGGFSFDVKDPLKRVWDKGIDQETAKDVREGTSGPGQRKRPK
jgi:2-keto-4-pentenoate hydratase/2-oxohepta-3-ene-1,7-dioic acid hydratase in catechol pathway